MQRVQLHLLKLHKRSSRLADVKLSPERVFEIAQAGSSYRLSLVIKILIKEQLFKRRIIVRCMSGSGVEFDSYEAIPLYMKDPALDIEFEISTDTIEVFYSPIINETI